MPCLLSVFTSRIQSFVCSFAHFSIISCSILHRCIPFSYVFKAQHFAELTINRPKQHHHSVIGCVAGKTEGDIRINGHPKEQSSFARVSGYVEQFDTHTAAATVREALIFSGTLRNGKDVDQKTTSDFVEQASAPIPLTSVS